MWRANCTRNSLWMLLNPFPLVARATIISLGLDLKEILSNTYACLIIFIGFCEDQMRNTASWLHYQNNAGENNAVFHERVDLGYKSCLTLTSSGFWGRHLM